MLNPAATALAGTQPHRTPRRLVDEHGDAMILAGDGADPRQVRMLRHRAGGRRDGVNSAC